MTPMYTGLDGPAIFALTGVRRSTGALYVVFLRTFDLGILSSPGWNWARTLTPVDAAEAIAAQPHPGEHVNVTEWAREQGVGTSCRDRCVAVVHEGGFHTLRRFDGESATTGTSGSW